MGKITNNLEGGGGPGASSPEKILINGTHNRDFLHSDTSFLSFFRVLQYLVIIW